MALTDEQIRKIMQKDIKAKTVLVSLENENKLIESYKKDGWEFVSRVTVNNKVKLTFRIVK